MKTVILAGGFGTRLSEKTIDIPKPMVEIGGRPILEHIMRFYASYGYEEFIVALGYKSRFVKEYFLNYDTIHCDCTVDLRNGGFSLHKSHSDTWKIHLVDTGLNTQTGGRLKRLKRWIGNERFMMTYGDGLTNVPIDTLVEFHKSHGKLATVLSVRPPSRFGELQFEENQVIRFREKPQIEDGWINGGFFVLEPEVFEYLNDDTTIWEQDPLKRLAQDGELMGFKHEDFFQPMDTMREWRYLESLWEKGEAPWLIKDRVL